MTPSPHQHLAASAAFASRLHHAHNFVEVAVLGCTAARELDLHCAMSLHSVSGEPIITVETTGAAAHGHLFPLLVPILVLTAQIGSIRWSAPRKLNAAVRDQLRIMELHVCVRLGQLGYVACDDRSALLTGRQNETARLAARGYTNGEIAEQLALSENTIKKHLKEVFDRLRVSSRSELAIRYARLGTRDDVPDGVTYCAACTITKCVTRDDAARKP
jgi:DNA-binding CsgD family transcriptional regulator